MSSYAAQETPRSAYMQQSYNRDDTEIIKRAKKLEKENRKLTKKYEENKLEYDLLKEEVRKLRQENKILVNIDFYDEIWT